MKSCYRTPGFHLGPDPVLEPCSQWNSDLLSPHWADVADLEPWKLMQTILQASKFSWWLTNPQCWNKVCQPPLMHHQETLNCRKQDWMLLSEKDQGQRMIEDWFRASSYSNIMTHNIRRTEPWWKTGTVSDLNPMDLVWDQLSGLDRKRWGSSAAGTVIHLD